jgi:hypothetical protein
MESEIIKTAMDLLTPVLEGSIIVAGEYVKLCGRRTITAQDVQYGMKYAARNVTGKHIGTMFPELQGSDSDESDIEEVDDDDDPFVRYTGPSNQLVDDVHQAVDTWDEWEPQNPTEVLLKAAVDKMGSSNQVGE